MTMHEAEDNASFILVMGITGAGKSYFINKIVGKDVAREGAQLQACTAKAVAIPATIGREKVLLIDTPGFDDTERSDAEILTEIAKLLAFQYETGMQLKGVIFLHRITDIRMQGSSMKTLQICRKICGTQALKNVVLVTTRWNEIDPAKGAQREAELRTKYWKFMLDFDSLMMRYHGDKDSAVVIASQLLKKDNIVLDIQRELVDQGRTLADTTAGSSVSIEIEEIKAQYEKELHDLQELRSELLRDQNSMRLQMQREIETERKRLEVMQSQQYAQQAALQAPIAEEVRRDIYREKNRRGTASKVLPFLPMCLSLLGHFVGIPSGTFEMFSSWFSGTGVGETLTDIFSSF